MTSFDENDSGNDNDSRDNLLEKNEPRRPYHTRTNSHLRSYHHLYILCSLIVLFIILIVATTLSQDTFDALQIQTLCKKDPLDSMVVLPHRPLSICGRCTDSSICDVFGERKIARSRAYEGTGERVQRVLAKASRGEKIKVGILGGSVSMGQKCNCPNATWHHQIVEWFKRSFPSTEIIHNDGSVRARGTNYFSLCHTEHLDQDVDIVFLEHAVNDQFGEGNIMNTERLVRSILEYPNRPAVVFVATMHHRPDRQLQGMDNELVVANYYDVPLISLRNALFESIQHNASLAHLLYGEQMDETHLVKNGHDVLANLTISYLAQQRCIATSNPSLHMASESIWPAISDDVPLQPIYGHYKPNTQTVKAPAPYPKCDSVDSPKHPLVPISHEGWEKWFQQGGKMGDPRTQKSYWRSSTPGARIAFDIETTLGDVIVYFLRSQSYNLGDAICWVDQARNKAKSISSYWKSEWTVGE